MQTETPDFGHSKALLTAREAASYLRIGVSTFWRDVAAGRMPQALYVNQHRPRWRLSEIDATIEASRAMAA